jgi:3-phosphoshikimate 1-carboxyvinyltransferase
MFNTDYLDIPPLAGAAGSVRLPGSKSISNRVLMLAALSAGTTRIDGLLESDDTSVMRVALAELGCKISSQGSRTEVTGLDGRLATTRAKLYMGNAGTAMRPLTAALALMASSTEFAPGNNIDFELSGVPRMHERPIADLVDALRQLGCNIDYLGNEGFPPLRIQAGRLRVDAPIQVRGDVSSQFLSSLLMALPLVARQRVHIEVVGELISKPYIAITLNLLARFGVAIERDGWARFTVPAGSHYRSPGDIEVEGDASSASYFIALGAVSACRSGTNDSQEGAAQGVEISGLGSSSIQGDIHFVEAAQAMGALVSVKPNSLHISRGAWPLKAIDLDCNAIPDAAMTLAVMALYADGPSVLRNIASWRVKETDRIAAMACELQKLGAEVEAGPDFIKITPPASPAHWRAATIATYDDHRMAMCFSLAALNPAKLPIRILDPKCVAKTFPDYFEALFELAQTAFSDIPVICIDGPTASGKGSLAASLAAKLGYHYLDSGALYRVSAFAASQAGVDLDDANAVAQIARVLPVRFDGDRVFLANIEVTQQIRTEAAGMAASRVSSLPQVRNALTDLQRSFRQLPGLVADGRDMGSVIFPDATLKVFLTASAGQRAARRYKQLISKGISTTLPTVLQDLEARDKRDTSRGTAPLAPADNAKLLDNSELSMLDSMAQVLDWWQSKQPF